MMKPASRQKLSSGEKLKDVLKQNRRLGSGGVYSVCSAHPWVLEAAIQRAVEDNAIFLVESTSSQVNQEGGYTEQTPAEFARSIRSAATQAGLAADQVLLGGDHLGPFPWRTQNSSIAMEKACALVHACVLAGYQKIHLDASMPCADDLKNPLEAEVVAQRAAVLAEAAEKAFAELRPGSDPPVYVIGTEVPAPGGETEAGAPPTVTSSDHVQCTLESFRSAFTGRKLSDAWERVIALVVQPGVEFGDDVVFPYDREKARLLSSVLPKDSSIVYEAHSTDYQSTQALNELVEDHFAILKVGPWLTFAFREAIFALSAMERELLGGNKAIRLSEVRQALENAMLRNPSHWLSYYHGDEAKQRFSRAYSYSDRCRYYWHGAEVQREIGQLLANLEDQSLPATLISQFLPLEYEAARVGSRSARPRDLVRSHIQAVLRRYAKACEFRNSL
jgi:D-tagatose-1,6-bisphosphate aldolase subunit GatZ/KbaZ